jgi:Protein of unknown function (DUF3467)
MMAKPMPETGETPVYYANVMQAHVGAYDFVIDFGVKRPETAPSAAPEPACRIIMSLGHAKTMLPIMARLIAAYEEQFGVIPAPGYEEKSKE